AAFGPIVKGSIACAEIEKIQFRIVIHRAPNGPPAAHVPIAFGVPGFCCGFELWIFVGFGWISRHGEESPRELAGIEIVSANVTPRVVFAAAISDYYHFSGNFRRAGGGVTFFVVDNRVGLPNYAAGGCVQRKKF